MKVVFDLNDLLDLALDAVKKRMNGSPRLVAELTYDDQSGEICGVEVCEAKEDQEPAK